ncbi:MAG: M20/M25/M40 family metallo-hydrolase [Candidatus Thermoplasmatota archaeon]
MRFVALLALLFLTALAGCLDGDGLTSAALGVDHSTAAPAVDATAVLADLRTFAETFPTRSGNQPDHEGSRRWLADKFEEYGLEVYRHDFTTGIPQTNIVGIKWGTLRDQWIVVGGHYDVVPTPGCPTGPNVPSCPLGTESQGMYDDGSGTLLTLHLAKAFAQVNTTYTIAFVAFDGEERGLQGSGNFSEAFGTGQTPFGNLTFHAMLDLDMFGLNWPGVDAPIYFDSNAPEVDANVQAVAAGLEIPEGEIKYQGISLGRSDYAHFFQLEVPTGFFISDFEEYQAPADVPAPAENPAVSAYPFWHRLDTWDTMVLMAGSEADVVAGFQTAADLASGLLWRFDDPDAVYTVDPAE